MTLRERICEIGLSCVGPRKLIVRNKQGERCVK